MVDTLGLIWGLAVLPANVQDWDGAKEVIRRCGERLPRLARVWADAGYKAFAEWVAKHCRWVLDLVTKRPGQTTFEAPTSFRAEPKQLQAHPIVVCVVQIICPRCRVSL